VTEGEYSLGGADSSVAGPELRNWPADELGMQLKPLLARVYGAWEHAEGTAHTPEIWYRLLVTALQAEAKTLDEAVALAAFCLAERIGVVTPEAQRALQGEHVSRVLRRFADTVSAPALATPELANGYLGELRRHFRDSEGLRGREVMFPLRAALTGSMVGPCLGNVTSLLGMGRCVERVEMVWTRLEP
jgi:glutamyl/glutaminyl-tRNA synthetase